MGGVAKKCEGVEWHNCGGRGGLPKRFGGVGGGRGRKK